MHRFYLDEHLPDPGQSVVVTGEEAIHAARVKRLEAGDAVEVGDGRGTLASGTVAEVHSSKAAPRVVVRIGAIRHVPSVVPRLEVASATPKGGRVDDMISGLAQAGAARWSPLLSARSVVDPREHKLDRLQRIAAEAAKQCGRAWLMEIGAKVEFARAVAGNDVATGGRGLTVLADASGEPFRPSAGEASPTATVRLLIGPEGGWTPDELDLARRSAGAVVARFGPHAMRIETAAVVATGIVLDRLAGLGGA